MTKKIFTSCIFIPLLLFANSILAQQTNAKEDYSAFLPEVRAFNKELARMPQEGSVLTKEGLAAARNSMGADPAIKTQLQPAVKYIPGPAGNIALRIFTPDTIRAVVLEIHGGGWSLGTAASDDIQNDNMARTCKVAVVSVDYRIAPEHAFPACINDCKAAAKWLVNNAMATFGTDKLFISGASAGGHLSAVTALYIRDSLHAIDKVRGVNLIYGCYDLSRTPSCRMATDSTIILNKKYLNETYELVFHGWSKEKLQDPQYSPLYADLKNLPPALFTIGTADPLIDDTYFMEARWKLAGNKTFLAVYPESSHAFNFFPSRMAKAANEKMFQWIIALCEK
ncbi:alpha/beta hydrolase [Ferruginibacter sp. SUN106]|uniref:alpha/beta hydrolase n=1 Tax=Ferruginibacter sp. SUN106 TaxID=2978348 RepID=UPI003D36B713